MEMTPLEIAIGRLWLEYMGHRDKRAEFAVRLFALLEDWPDAKPYLAEEVIGGMGIGAWGEVARRANHLLKTDAGGSEIQKRWAALICECWNPDFLARLIAGVDPVLALQQTANPERE